MASWMRKIADDEDLVTEEDLWAKIESMGPREQYNIQRYLDNPDEDLDFKEYVSEYERRMEFIKELAWAVPTKEAVKAIAGFVGGGRALEIGAGTGLWSYLIQQAGVNPDKYAPTDVSSGVAPGKKGKSWIGRKYHGMGKMQRRTTFVPVQKMSVDQAIEAYGDYEVLILVWPPYNTPMAANALKGFRGNRIIYVGEGEGGCTADDEFHAMLSKDWKVHKKFTTAASKNWKQWNAIHDCITFYERK